MRVLVTGAQGFIGRHVVEHILEVTDWDVVMLDVKHTVDYATSRVMRVHCDLRRPLQLPDMGEINAVVNLASLADVGAFLDAPSEYLRDNVDMQLTLLEWARHQRLTHFVQLSTNEVYGPSWAGEAHTEWSPTRPPTPYSASKAAQEAACFAWWYSYGVPVVILNAMHVFGEGQPPARFIPTAIRRLRAGEPVTVYGREIARNRWIPSRRNWLYVRDLADAIVWNLCRDVQHRRDVEFPVRFNVAGPAVNCVSLVERLARLLGVDEWSVDYVDVREARPGHELVYELDGKSVRIAGWQPPFGFNGGLERTVGLGGY